MEPLMKFSRTAQIFLFLFVCGVITLASSAAGNNSNDPQASKADHSAKSKGRKMADKVVKTDEEWRKRLTPEQDEGARGHGTERAFTGPYWDNHGQGICACVCCGQQLLDPKTQFDSGPGWPSFYAPISEDDVVTHKDTSYGMVRVEVLCSRCDAHLGHVFNDG